MEIFSGKKKRDNTSNHPHIQHLLGFHLDDYESELIDKVLDKNKKALIYKACIKRGGTDLEIDHNVGGALLTVVTVQEARLQAEIVYALHAVTQFMH